MRTPIDPPRCHYHNGTSCHGSETVQECLDEAVKRGWIGKVLAKVDVDASGQIVRCYSMIVGAFDHWAKHGEFVAETKIVGQIFEVK